MRRTGLYLLFALLSLSFGLNGMLLAFVAHPPSHAFAAGRTEYDAVTVPQSCALADCPKLLSSLLNKRAADGWQLVEVVMVPVPTAILRR